MAVVTDEIIDVLRQRGILPDEETGDVDLPGIGEVEEGETIYSTSIDEVLGEPDDEPTDTSIGDGRLNELRGQLGDIIGREHPQPRPRREAPEPHCAWYCPIHFFGHSWGIYIREHCILSCAIEIASFVDWRAIPNAPARRDGLARQLLRSAFYVFYLHEHFHHKVESLGFRLLIATAADRYRPYKTHVYRPSFGTANCIEESLANADSYRRLSERRYVKRHDKAILDGLRSFLKASFPLQPPGYAEAMNFLNEPRYREGLWSLQSQVLDGRPVPATPTAHWVISPNMITSLMDITDNIYVVLPRGVRPIFRPTTIDPGYTVSSKDLVGALTKYHGYQEVPGGKGSHVKLTKPGAPNIHVPGNRNVLSPGVAKQALKAIGGYALSRLPDLVQGRLAHLAEIAR
jgi:HicA toxin of bacterial toxin-antitoxin,